MFLKKLLTLYFRQYCFQHQAHLCVKDHLKCIEAAIRPAYFSDIAKVVNVWRYGTVRKKLRKAYASAGLGDSRREAKLFHRFPQRALRGRWGAIDTTEKDLLSFTPEELQACWLAVFGAPSEEGPCGTSDGQPRSEGGLADVEADERRVQMGRWRREATLSIFDQRFWLTMMAASASRSPVEHFRRWMLKTCNVERGEEDAGTLPPMVSLVCQKATVFLDEFEELCTGSTGRHLMAFRFINDLRCAEQTAWLHYSLYLTLSLAIDYFRRVVLVVRRPPFLFAWLVFRPPDVACAERQAFARDLLEDEFATLNDDVSTPKLLFLFDRELRAVSCSGKVDPTLWHFVKDMFSEWAVDTTTVEGTSNQIKSIVRMAPFIGWKTLSDRLTSAKYIRGVGIDSKSVDELLCKCEEHHHRIAELSAPAEDTVRYFSFVDPDASEDGEHHRSPPAPPKPTATRHQSVAAKMIAAMKREPRWGVARAHATACKLGLCITVGTDVNHWIPVHHFRAAVWCVRIEPHNRHEYTLTRPLLMRPLGFLLSDAVRAASDAVDVVVTSVLLTVVLGFRFTVVSNQDLEALITRDFLSGQRGRAEHQGQVEHEPDEAEVAACVLDAYFGDDAEDDPEGASDVCALGALGAPVASAEQPQVDVDSAFALSLGLDPSAPENERQLDARIAADDARLPETAEAELETSLSPDSFWEQWDLSIRGAAADFEAIRGWTNANSASSAESSSRQRRQRNMSFVRRDEYKDDCCIRTYRWVHWDDYERKRGRFVRMDRAYAVYEPPGANRANVRDWAADFAADIMAIVIEDVGCAMVRASSASFTHTPNTHLHP